STRSNRPQFISAFSTLSRAVALAFGWSSGSPASGLMATNTVWARKTYSGREDLFLSLAIAGVASRITSKNSEETRAAMGSLRRSATGAAIITGAGVARLGATAPASNVLGF